MAAVIDTEWYSNIEYRPTPTGKQTITGQRDIHGINYIGGGDIKVNRQQALGLGQQNIADLGSGKMPPTIKKTDMKGGRTPLGRLHERHLGGEQDGGSLFGKLWKKVKKTAKKFSKEVAKEVDKVEDFIEDAGEFFSKKDAGSIIGKEIASMLNKAEEELIKAGKSIEKSAERGTLLSDALKLTAEAVDKYGPEMAGYIVGGMVASTGVGFLGKQVASNLTKEIVEKLKLDEITADAINKLAKEAEQKGMNTRATGRPQPHYTYKTASRLNVPFSSPAMSNRDQQIFVSIHPMNFRKSTIKEL